MNQKAFRQRCAPHQNHYPGSAIASAPASICKRAAALPLLRSSSSCPCPAHQQAHGLRQPQHSAACASNSKAPFVLALLWQVCLSPSKILSKCEANEAHHDGLFECHALQHVSQLVPPLLPLLQLLVCSCSPPAAMASAIETFFISTAWQTGINNCHLHGA